MRYRQGSLDAASVMQLADAIGSEYSNVQDCLSMEMNPYKIAAGAVFVAAILGGVLPKMKSDSRAPSQTAIAPPPVASPTPQKPVVIEPAVPAAAPAAGPASNATPAHMMIQGGPKLPGMVDGVTLNGKPIAAETQPPNLRETLGDDAYELLRQGRN